MGLPVRYYHSTDAGAPITQITKPSDYITILKACLVDGYGTKAGAGWTLEFEDTTAKKAVFRNSVADGGSGGAVQVQPHGTDASGNYVRFTAAGAITAIDTFVNRIPYRAYYTNSSATYSNGWMVVATSRGFWVIVNPGTGASGDTNSANQGTYVISQPTFFVGDIQSAIPNDLGVFTIVCSTASQGVDYLLNSSTVLLNSGDIATGAYLYATDGSASGSAYSHFDKGPNTTASTGNNTDPTVDGVPIDIQPVTLFGGSNTSIALPRFRGIVPGLFFTNYYGFRGFSTPIIRTFDGVDYRLITGYRVAHLFVQMSGEWYES
ncbi:hypothetical protein [Shewanella mangrovisoli]|uniref:Virion structural protein n=1 Tax=Shewanella mangrovisoli TaxID=2864211 RepID=A0ABV4VI01_9GAMM